MPPESSSAGGAGRSDRTRDDVRGEDVTRGTAPGAGVPGYRGRAAAYAVGRSRPSGSGRGLRIARCSPPRLPRVSRTVAGRDDPRIHGGVVEDPSCSPEVSGEMRTAWIGSPATGYMIGGPSSTRIRSGPPRRGSRTGLRDRRCPVPGRAATSGGGDLGTASNARRTPAAGTAAVHATHARTLGEGLPDANIGLRGLDPIRLRRRSVTSASPQPRTGPTSGAQRRADGARPAGSRRRSAARYASC